MSQPGTLLPLVRLDAIPATGLAVSYPAGPFPETAILLLIDGHVRAWKNRCRHLALALDGPFPGHFLTKDGQFLICQEHGALYRPDDGRCVAGPCEGAGLRPLAVVVREGTVFLASGERQGVGAQADPP